MPGFSLESYPGIDNCHYHFFEQIRGSDGSGKIIFSNFNINLVISAASPFDVKVTGYGISGLHKAAGFAAIYKAFPDSISRNVKSHQKVMRTALKEVNEMQPAGFLFSIGRELLIQGW